MGSLVRMIVRGVTALGFSVILMCAGSLAAGDLNGTWELVEINARPIPPASGNPRPVFTIKDQSIEGFDGCNTFSGRLDKPGSIVSTRRGCAEGIVKLPLDLADPMAHLKTGKIQKDTLVLPAREGTGEAVFRRVKPTP
jgi:heat shock protein HslJ